MTVTNPRRQLLTRKEAAAYLTENWIKVSAACLAVMASRGKGPEYQVHPDNGRAYYTREELDRWGERGMRSKPTLPAPTGALAAAAR